MLEWIVGGLGALLVGGAIAFLVYHALTRDLNPARRPRGRAARTRPGEPLPRAVSRVQPGRLGRGGADDRRGSSIGPDGSTETSEAVLDYVPARSGREGGLWFSGDPRAGQLTLRATGYADP